jgi:hypothetical protein
VASISRAKKLGEAQSTLSQKKKLAYKQLTHQYYYQEIVPRDGIEPSTQGFSVPNTVIKENQ